MMTKFVTLLAAALMATMASAQMRGSLNNNNKVQITKDNIDASTWAKFHAHERLLMEREISAHQNQGRELQAPPPPGGTPVPTLPPANFKISGTYGERRRCFDKRFTMVCSWEAEKKVKKHYGKSHRRRLGNAGPLDFDDEEEEWEQVQTKEITAPDGRRLKVELDNVECILGVGKKDSADSDDEYEEYKERIGFPDDRWTIKIGEQFDSGAAGIFTSYGFETRVTFEDIEDPNSSGDEITISGNLFIRMACFIDPATGEDFNLLFRSHDVRIIC